MVARGAKGSNGMALMVWLERPLGQNGLSQKGYVRSAFCSKPQTKLYTAGIGFFELRPSQSPVERKC